MLLAVSLPPVPACDLLTHLLPRLVHPVQQRYSATSGGVSAIAASLTSSLPSQVSTAVVTRVRALHTCEPAEPRELAFEKGEVIKVVDRGYKNWWRGQLKGRIGIFPVVYVEPLPEPTATELACEAEPEASVFAQAANVDRLLTMLRGLGASSR
ncbi:SH3 domain-containing protein [Suillus subluteus]|nr:SH3 domain-containing protein [Suillus subluteus]